jgi:hypothetical protein
METSPLIIIVVSVCQIDNGIRRLNGGVLESSQNQPTSRSGEQVVEGTGGRVQSRKEKVARVRVGRRWPFALIQYLSSSSLMVEVIIICC